MREHGGTRRRTLAWPVGPGVALRPAWPRFGGIRGWIDSAWGSIRRWAAEEVAPGRLFPWLAIAFGSGAVLYFAAPREPNVTASIAAALTASVLAVLLRRRAWGFPIMLAIAALTAGLATLTFRASVLDHPILSRAAWNVEIEGWIVTREERERTDRVVIAVHRIEARGLEQQLARIRVSVRKGTAPAVGSFVALKARLNPPLAPLRPGGYDFARDMYFQGIGASGFALGAIKQAKPPDGLSATLRYRQTLAQVRDGLDRRIREAIPGDAGAIASALITGKRDAISSSVNEAMYVSSLAHVLSISGYHMAVVTGLVFFAVRGLLALIPSWATGRPIKKIAAVVAFIAATFYLLLSGAEVATQRAYIMTAIVLLGILVDRPALTLRTLAVAALAVMAITPEAVVHPSFQMSFAATLALVAFYQRQWTIGRADAQSSWRMRVALWGGREIVSLLFASIIAGAATTLYAAYHFHRLAPYGVLANLLAMPLVSFLIMPAGLLALCFAPFGFDTPLWTLMGIGIDWMTSVALWVASLPGAVRRIAAFGVGPLLAGSAGLIIMSLLRTPLRWTGALVLSLAIGAALRTPLPDVLIAPGAQAVAVRTSDGRLTIARTGSDTFAIREWLAADGDPRNPGDASVGSGFRCDELGCVAALGDGRLVALAIRPEAFLEDCARAAIVVSARERPPDCSAQVIDRTASQQNGAMALRRAGEVFAVEAARPSNYDRPWSWRESARSRPAPVPNQDATPAPEQREVDD